MTEKQRNIDKDRIDKGLYWQKAWKLVEGCTKVSPGCDNCWSESETVMRHNHPNKKIHERAHQVLTEIPNHQGGSEKFFAGNVLEREDNLDLPLKRKQPTVFAIWNDLYHEDVSDEFRDRAYAVMALCPQHTFLVLTKRAEGMESYFSHGRWREYLSNMEDDCIALDVEIAPLPGAFRGPWPLPNVWHGITAESQDQANTRIKGLFDAPGKRFLSIEPLLGPVDLLELERPFRFHYSPYGWPDWLARYLHAVLVGCESGSNARLAEHSWLYTIEGQCRRMEIPLFIKQIQVRGRLSKNITIWPSGLQVRDLAWLSEGL